jgi:uncharacterized protein
MMIKNALTFSTIKGNRYLYSQSKNQLMLCHPLVQHFFLLEKQGKSPEKFIKSISGNINLMVGDNLSFSKSECLYQYEKYRFLKKNGYLKPEKQVSLDGILSASRITENLSAIKQVIFETTEDCNLDCTYCIYSKFYINKERGKRNFNLADAVKMLELILGRRDKRKGKELIISFYGGEPLKNFKFIREIVGYLSARPGWNPVFRFTMSSNGLLLEKYMDFLAANWFDISISLDGDANANSFRILKNNKPSYELVVKNLDAVKQKYPDYFKTNISFLTVLHGKNSYDSVFRFFLERYEKKPIVSTINTLGVNKEHTEEFRKTFLEQPRQPKNPPKPVVDTNLRDKLFLHHPNVKELADTIEYYSGFIFKTPNHLMVGKKARSGKQKFMPTATCLPFSLRTFIAADGSILPCEHISRIFEIGTLKSQEVRINPENIAEMYNQYYKKIKPLCDQCYLSDHCKECVFNTNIETDHPECEFFTNENHFSKILSKNLSIIETDYSFYLRILNEAYHEQ